MCEDQCMMSFKDILKDDVKQVFLNFDEYGESHTINGQEVTIIVDDNELTEREKRFKRNDKGELHKKQLLFYIAAEDFGPLPAPRKTLTLDKKEYIITEAEDEGGIYSISLEAQRS